MLEEKLPAQKTGETVYHLQAPPPLPLVDRLRQRQEQEAQRPEAQTDTASAFSDTGITSTAAAQRRHDSMQMHRPRSSEEDASPKQQASQLPSASGPPHDRGPDPSRGRSGSAATAAAVLHAAPAKVGPTEAQQLGWADSVMIGSRPQPLLSPAATDSTNTAAGVSFQANQAAKPSSSLQNSGAALSIGGWTSEQSAQSAASKVMLEGQSAAAAMPEQQVAAAESENVPGQSEAEPMHGMLQSRRAMLLRLQQQQQQHEEAVMSAQLGSLLQQREQASAQVQTDAAAAAAAGVPDQLVVRQTHQTVMPLAQLAVVPEQAIALVPQQREAEGGHNLAHVPQQHEAEGGQNLAPVPQQHEAAGVVPNDDHPMAFEELVGLRGPIRLLFENAGTVIVSSAMFVGAALWAPFMWGSLTIKGIAMVQASWKLTVLPAAAMQLLLRNHQV